MFPKCRNGHSMHPSNTYVHRHGRDGVQRTCRTCQRDRLSDRYWQRNFSMSPTKRTEVEQGIARGDRLEWIAEQVQVPLEGVYQIADAMDKAANE